MHFFTKFVRDRIPSNWRENNTGWISGNCPVCVVNGETRPDRKRRGGFHFGMDEWVYHCFNCGFKTGWKTGSQIGIKVKTLLKQFNIEEAEIQRLSIELLRETETTKLLNPVPQVKNEFVPTWSEIALPDGCNFLYEIDDAQINNNLASGIGMLAERDLLHWSDWAYTSKEFKYRKRLILPYRWQGKIVGYTARLIGNIPNQQTPKYIVTKPPNFVFNLDRQHVDRTLAVVVEGDFDAISIDAVSLGGNSISDGQASLINQLERRVILLPDADAAGSELVEPAINQGWDVSFPDWQSEFKDANQAAQHLGRAFVLRSIIDAAISNPTKIRVLAKRHLK